MAAATPPAADRLVALAEDHGYTVATDTFDAPVTMDYGDGHTRDVDARSYAVMGQRGRARFVVAWTVNPWTDRWWQRVAEVTLLNADDVTRRLSEAFGFAGGVTWAVPRATIERMIRGDRLEASLAGWAGDA